MWSVGQRLRKAVLGLYPRGGRLCLKGLSSRDLRSWFATCIQEEGEGTETRGRNKKIINFVFGGICFPHMRSPKSKNLCPGGAGRD